jgi:hypothetical protein
MKDEKEGRRMVKKGLKRVKNREINKLGNSILNWRVKNEKDTCNYFANYIYF